MRMVGRSRTTTAAVAAHFVLPVTGLTTTLHHPTGVEDMLLAEHQIDDPRLVLALVQRLAGTQKFTDWNEVPVSDIDTVVVRLRQVLIGNRVLAEVTCTNVACAATVDLSFQLDTYLEHHHPRRSGILSRRTRTDATAGWFVFATNGGERLRFRLPTLRDQIAVGQLPGAVAALADRCMDEDSVRGRWRMRVEAAMMALAPPLAGPLRGSCPHCGRSIRAWFHARHYCLQELQDRARFIHDDVDTLAKRYHWSERAILRLPQVRRVQYVERARQTSAGWPA